MELKNGKVIYSKTDVIKRIKNSINLRKTWMQMLPKHRQDENKALLEREQRLLDMVRFSSNKNFHEISIKELAKLYNIA